MKELSIAVKPSLQAYTLRSILRGLIRGARHDKRVGRQSRARDRRDVRDWPRYRRAFREGGSQGGGCGAPEREGNEATELVRAAGGEGLLVKADVSKASEVDALIQKTVETFGRLDLAFNNAGIEGRWVPIIKQSEEDWDQTIDINLKESGSAESMKFYRCSSRAVAGPLSTWRRLQV